MNFSRVLIANRGEIALRIIRSARDRGFYTVAVYSDVDRDAPFVRAADLSFSLGPAEASQSYLHIKKIIAAAKATGADAVHPGYGFLAENAEFAAACREAGLVFIGPTEKAIRLMGDKRAAKKRMLKADIPCVPGYEGSDDTKKMVAAAKKLGFPLLIKASAGGGGRGIRRVDSAKEVESQIALAQSEAKSAFGDSTLILEKLIEPARHIEVQVFGDEHGNVVHLYERDCSTQRRHQKVIEETPAALTEKARKKICKTAVKIAKTIDYVGAGTCEFLVDENEDFYFLEMNTRLQVEHPITEEATNLDLVDWQFEVALGFELPATQEDIEQSAHAVEARIYAEEPAQAFRPSTGEILRFEYPKSDVRVDAGIDTGAGRGGAVSPHYDAMVAKFIAVGMDRGHAFRQLRWHLSQTVLHGVKHNIGFLLNLLDHGAMVSGTMSTSLVDAELEQLTVAPDAQLHRAFAAAIMVGADRGTTWFRTSGLARTKVRLDFGEGPQDFRVSQEGEAFRIQGDEFAGVIELVVDAPNHGRFVAGGLGQKACWDVQGDTVWLTVGGHQTVGERVSSSTAAAKLSSSDDLRAPMAGKVVSVKTSAGAEVKKGEVLLVLEAMKMQLELTAPRDGAVESLSAAEGDQVASKQVLAKLTPES